MGSALEIVLSHREGLTIVWVPEEVVVRHDKIELLERDSISPAGLEWVAGLIGRIKGR